MRIKFKIILLTTLIISLTLSTTTYAQNSAGEKIRSIGNFFTAFFDLDNTTNYLRDTFVQNQCRKRDLFALYAQKDALADTLVDEYKNLTNDQIDDIKTQYAVLTGELRYVRNIGDKTEEELEQAVLSGIRPRISNYTQDIREQIPLWHAKYSDRFEEYIECRSSWQVVKDQVDSIKENAKQIGTDWGNFKDQFNQTGEALLDTPGGLYRNTRDAVVDGAKDSFNQTIDNIDSEAERFIADFSRDEVDPESAYDEIITEELDSIQAQQNLAQILESERSLTAIPTILRQQQERFEIDQDAALEYAQTRIEQSHSDSAAYVLWNDILQLNYNLQRGNQLMSNDQDGIIILAETTGDRQCSL
jgi:gas vesicle protein